MKTGDSPGSSGPASMEFTQRSSRWLWETLPYPAPCAVVRSDTRLNAVPLLSLCEHVRVGTHWPNKIKLKTKAKLIFNHK